MAVNRSPALEAAKTFLTIPDLLNYWLTGRAVCEFTNATTTQCYDPRQREWAEPLLQAMGIPRAIFPEVIPPGTVLGDLSGVAAEEANVTTPVIAPATHDTGSAVAAVPASEPAFAWISSGTWSVVGTELPEPVISAQSLANNFTNEGGVQSTFRFSKNVMGLWLLQECRRVWRAAGDDLSYSKLTEMAKDAAPLASIVDPDWGEFLKPGDMPGRIQEFCRQTGQTIPEGKPDLVRCILESIALKYRWVFERLDEMTGRKLEPIHIVGGGTQNHLLSQFTADATGRRVITGPVEATATGNILMQAVALGDFASIWEGRQVVRASTELLTFEPGPQAAWDEAYEKLLGLLSQGR
jgi:rhamnulokinase